MFHIALQLGNFQGRDDFAFLHMIANINGYRLKISRHLRMQVYLLKGSELGLENDLSPNVLASDFGHRNGDAIDRDRSLRRRKSMAQEEKEGARCEEGCQCHPSPFSPGFCGICARSYPGFLGPYNGI